MRKLTILLLLVCTISWSCESAADLEPEVQQVQTGQSFWMSDGETVHLSNEGLLISITDLQGWHPEAFTAPMSIARLGIRADDSETQISISHRLKCEYEFNGKEEFCERNEAFFQRLDDLSSTHSNEEHRTYEEVAPLGNGLKLYMLLIKTDEVNSTGDNVKVKSAEFLIMKD